MHLRTHLALAASLALAAGCYEDNPNYIGPDGGPGDTPVVDCESDADCTDDLPACDLEAGVCVQCTAANPGACGAQVCGDDQMCRACVEHTECAGSEACLADGACALPTDVAYVQQGATGTCAIDAPCGTVAAALGTGRKVIKLVGTADVAEPNRITIASHDVELIADPDVGLRREGAGPLLRVENQRSVTISRMTLFGGPANMNDYLIDVGANAGIVRLIDTTVTGHSQSAILVSGGALSLVRSAIVETVGTGLRATDGSVSIDRSIIANNDRGIDLSSTAFTITSSLIVLNGSTGASVGGIRIAEPDAGSRLAFTTIAGNNASTTVGTDGIYCADAFAVESVIVDNEHGGFCTYTSSFTSHALPLMGDDNFVATPRFVVSAGSDHASPDFFRLLPDSPGIDAGGTAGVVPPDIDGTDRGAMPDIGADELNL